MPRPAALAVLLLAAAAAPAQPEPAGRVDSAGGSFLRRAAGKAGFEPLARGDLFDAGDLLVGLPGAALASANGGVRLTARADYDAAAEFPVLETAVVVHPTPGFDLDATLDRGRVELANAKPAGAATARVRFHKQQWVVTLDRADSRVAVEVLSRWPAGSAFSVAPAAGHEPAAAAALVVLAGTASVSDGRTTLALTAPPGPTRVEWASTGDDRLAARRLDNLPDWAGPAAVLRPGAGEVRDATEAFRAAVAGGKLEAVVDAFLASAKPAERRVGLIAAGATDDLPRLQKAIAGEHDRELWDFGVSVLRHWLGRGPGQDRALYQYLTGGPGFTPAQAEITVQLLHGFDAADQRRPETFEVLIEYLQNDRPAVRNLAAWHLLRLAPGGKAIPFRPNASKAEFEPVYKGWKGLVPPGRVPAFKEGTSSKEQGTSK